MGLFDILSKIASAGERYVEKQSNNYHSGYDRGSDRASRMSDDELRSELRRARDNGISGGMSGAGKTRAMMDEYNERNKN